MQPIVTGRPIMAFLMIAAALVLLIGCANLANMLLARSRSRERVIGMCAALGATRLRIVRPIVFETVIVGVASAALALLVTAISFDLLLRQGAADCLSQRLGPARRAAWLPLR
jgi:predicted lysophospholipase L1 biosynthesis ABC-type transport system permease subunit